MERDLRGEDRKVGTDMDWLGEEGEEDEEAKAESSHAQSGDGNFQQIRSR
jgi:hypothetical protein